MRVIQRIIIIATLCAFIMIGNIGQSLIGQSNLTAHINPHNSTMSSGYDYSGIAVNAFSHTMGKSENSNDSAIAIAADKSIDIAQATHNKFSSFWDGIGKVIVLIISTILYVAGVFYLVTRKYGR